MRCFRSVKQAPLLCRTSLPQQVGILTQCLIVHMIRTERIPFIQEVCTRLKPLLPLRRPAGTVAGAEQWQNGRPGSPRKRPNRRELVLL